MQCDVPWDLRSRVSTMCPVAPAGLEADGPPTIDTRGQPRSEAMGSEDISMEAREPAQVPAVEPVGTTTRPPAPLTVSDEAHIPRAARVPDAPTMAEKELHYLTHLPFRACRSYCTRGAAPDDPHHTVRSTEAPRLPIAMMD